MTCDYNAIIVRERKYFKIQKMLSIEIKITIHKIKKFENDLITTYNKLKEILPINILNLFMNKINVMIIILKRLKMLILQKKLKNWKTYK